ncbi:MAG TPA: family 20 glycosylhydrolase [Acidobacteriaceae bacterium]|nr:family 20 glycosylhydrolase [Acidobacteriaceae bacterium]
MVKITRVPRGVLRLFFAVILFSAPLAPLRAQPAPALQLIPMPRQVRAGPVLSLDHGVLVRTGSLDAEDRFTADDLRAAIEEHGVSAHTGGPMIELLRNNTASARASLAAAHLTFDPAMHDEGYVIVPQPHELAVIAATSAGLFYGAQTVKQLIVGNGEDAYLETATVSDWPALPHRGLDDDLSRGPVPTLEFQERQVRTLAAYKLNIYSPYFEQSLAYSASPLVAPPGGAMSPADVATLIHYAAQYHITVVPEQEAFGHLHHVLKYEEFSALGETPHGQVLSPVQPGSLALIRQWFTQITQQFPSPWVHIGADETNELGKGQTGDLVAQRGLDQVYVDFLRQIHGVIQPTGKRILFWGDLAWHNPDLVAALPKDMIGVPWVYDALPDFDKYIRPFNRAGMEVWVAPGVNNWRRVYPDNNVALVNIQHFVRDGQRLGARGMLNTVWNDDGEGIFDEDWYGVLFGAAASWQPGESSLQQFETSYGAVFHGDLSGKIDKAQGQIMAAQKLLADNGFRFGGSNALFWEDPWSPAGQQDSAKLLPILKDVRLYAENAITLLDEARAANPLRQQDALDALALGARRIDFIGMKFQFADEIAHAYADAYSEAATPHSRAFSDLVEISNANGRCQDLRDGYTLTRELFEQAWLRDNRPYWLQNVLAQYDMATQLWITRAREFDSLRAQLAKTHTLPRAEEIGVPIINGD